MSDWLKKRKTKATKRPDVFLFHSIEGGGKTSFAANFPDPTFAMSESETGLLTLMSRGLVPDCGYFPQFMEFDHIVEATREMKAAPKKLRPRTFVIDTLNGVAGLVIDKVCREQYGGEMSKKGFLGFGEGIKAAVPVWQSLLRELDELRNLGTTIVLLCHTVVVNFKSPEGPDYNRFVPELPPPLWSATKKIADMVCFINFNTQVLHVDEQSNTGKGAGGSNRVYYFDRRPAFDAKQRHGIGPLMAGSGSPAGDFRAFVETVKAGLATAKPGKSVDDPPEAIDIPEESTAAGSGE